MLCLGSAGGSSLAGSKLNAAVTTAERRTARVVPAHKLGHVGSNDDAGIGRDRRSSLQHNPRVHADLPLCDPGLHHVAAVLREALGAQLVQAALLGRLQRTASKLGAQRRVESPQKRLVVGRQAAGARSRVQGSAPARASSKGTVVPHTALVSFAKLLPVF